MAPFLSTQPSKALYTSVILLTAPLRATALCLKYSVKPLHPDWNVQQSLCSAFLDDFFHYSTTTRSRHVLDNDPKTAKERYVRVEPPPTELFTGALAPTSVVKPAAVEGVWLPRAPPKAELRQEKVFIHFPGGAFVVTFGHEFSGRPVSEILTKDQGLNATSVLWAHYRLAEGEDTRFPAAVQDALSFYRHVLSLGVDPKNITLSGDSAGGNIALALLRYLETARLPELPLPGGVIVFSPWVNVTTRAGADFERCDNHSSDIINGPFLQWGAESYLPSKGELSADVKAFVSPLGHPFKTSVPIFVWAGAIEAFCDDIRVFATEMAKVPGNKIKFHAQDKAAHDLLTNLNLFKLEDGFHAAMKEAREFFQGGTTANL